MTNQELLNDLMSLSPQIDNRISELTSSAIQEDFDPVDSIKTLLIEATRTLINIFKDLGIEFYVDENILLADSRGIDFLSSLYKQYIPDHIEEQFLNDSALLRCIVASTTDISDNEYICSIIETVRDIHPSTYNIDMYNFFHDKVLSTDVYTSAIDEILNERQSYDDYDKDVVVTGTEMSFLIKVADERIWHQKCMMELIYKKIAALNYEKMTWLTTQFGSAYCMPKNIVVLSKYETLIKENKEVVEKVLHDIRTSSRFYVDHYTDAEISNLSQEMIVSIVLAQISDKRLFGRDVDFTRIILKRDPTIPIEDIIKSIPIQNKVN